MRRRGAAALKALGWAASAPVFLAALVLVFGDMDEGAALARWIGWGFARVLCLAAGLGCLALTGALWKWCLGIRSWDDYSDSKNNNDK